MDLSEALRTTGSSREFTDEPVDDATLAAVLDDARFAPSGGNRQPWRVVVVKDGAIRRRLADLMTDVWQEYLADSSDPDAGAVCLRSLVGQRSCGRTESVARRHRTGSGRVDHRRRPQQDRADGRQRRAPTDHRRRVDLPVRVEHPAGGEGPRARWRADDISLTGRRRSSGRPRPARQVTPWLPRSSSGTPCTSTPDYDEATSRPSPRSTDSTEHH